MATLLLTAYTSTCSKKSSIKAVVEVEDDPMNDDSGCTNDTHDKDDSKLSSSISIGSVGSSDTAEDVDDDFVIVNQPTPTHHLVVDERIPDDNHMIDDSVDSLVVEEMVADKTTVQTWHTAKDIDSNDINDAFDEANQNENTDDDDDDDLFLPAQQNTQDRNDEDNEEIVITGPTILDGTTHENYDVRNCVSPVMHEGSSTGNSSRCHRLDDDDDLTDLYATPMSSPIRSIVPCSNNTGTNTSTAIVSWPLPNQLPNTWNVTNNVITPNAPFQGLCNLGNTCYMASALQMICSVPSFTDLVSNDTPSAPSGDTKLRAAFLSLMEQIRERKSPENSTNHNGPISPQTLKEAMDDRTSLFAGYRQHDAHEFITALLDLLDEDYKPKLTKNAEDVAILDVITNPLEPMDVVVDSGNEDETKYDVKKSAADYVNDDSGETIVNQSDGDNVEIYTSDTTSSKKQKMDESITIHTMDTTPDIDVESTSCSMQSLPTLLDDTFNCNGTVSCTQNYSELDVDAIERLIHGNGSTKHTDTSTITASRGENYNDHESCKLLGGRMNTNDIILTPYSNNDRNESTSSSRQPSLFHGSTITQQPQPNPATATLRDVDNMNDRMIGSDDDNEDDMKNETVVVSPIDATFTTEVRVRLTCDSCKFTRTHKETYLHLSLEIGAPTAIDDMYSSNDECGLSIDDGIRRFFAPCTQELKCEKCFCETATQSMEITKLPPALLLHLKRFIVDYSPDWSSISYSKNQSAVHVNTELSVHDDCSALTEFISSDCLVNKKLTSSGSVSIVSTPTFQATTSASKYVLRSVVNHIGPSANCGHYTADAQRGEQNEWFRFNDTYVSYLSATEVIEQSKQTAYMCLYELV